MSARCLFIFISQEDIAAIFAKADKSNTGKLTATDAKEVVKDIWERYPQVEIHLKKKKLSNFVDLMKNAEGDEGKQLDIERFKSALCEVDSQMKNLPATAQVLSYPYQSSTHSFSNLPSTNAKFCCLFGVCQVAAQQGEYLADCFDRMEECEKNPEGPLRFRGIGRHRFHPFRHDMMLSI